MRRIRSATCSPLLMRATTPSTLSGSRGSLAGRRGREGAVIYLMVLAGFPRQLGHRTIGAMAAEPPVRRPGRPRDATIDARVLDAARELLVEQGFDATTVQAIAERAGVHA